MSPVAVWMWRYGTLDVDVWGDELTAATYVHEVEVDGNGSFAGISRPDGSFTEPDDWEALRAVQAEADERFQRDMEAAKNRPRPAMKTQAPHPALKRAVTRNVTVSADTPEWVFGRTEQEK